jgi:hypothetical protein
MNIALLFQSTTMKQIVNIINTRWLAAVAFAIIVLVSCTKWDDYKKYTDGGEIVYAGKLDSVKVLSGKNRVMVTGKFNADPAISQVRIFWNDNHDSVSYDIKRSTGGNYFQQAFAMPEGVTTFTVYTYDASGHRSVPVTVTGKSYGANYRKKLSNRVINNIRYLSGSTTITWEAADASVGAYTTELQYTVNGITSEISTPATDNTVFGGLPNTTALFRYRAIFKPDSTCIDTFAVAYKDTLVVPFKNSRVSFAASAKSGRWGNLADWNANAAIQSHGGYGGWDEWNSNIFNVESGWGAPPITNGKLWQVFTLPAGTYTFEISDLMDTNLTSADNAYLVVAPGSDLPDVSNIGTALAATQIVAGKPLNDLRARFTLTQSSQVSIGYLTTQPDGTPGRYCNIRAFGLYVNY